MSDGTYSAAGTDLRVRTVMNSTGTTSEVACNLLQGNGWDVNRTIASYLGFTAQPDMIQTYLEPPIDYDLDQDSAVQNVLVQTRSVKNVPVQKSVVQNVPVQKSAVQNVPVQKSTVQNVPVQKSAIQNVPVQKSAVQNVPVQKSAVQNVPVQKSAVQNVPAQKSAGQNVVQKSAVPNVPVQKSAVQSVPAQKSAVQNVKESTEALDDTKPPDIGKLQRGMSKANINVPLVLLARDIMLQDPALSNGDSENTEEFFQDKTEYTFILPDIMRYPEDLKAFLYKDLIETSMLVSLEQGGRLNWWADVGICDRLLPMVTSGDGNCLLHAASLAMWGFHDRSLALRKALNKVMTGSKVSSSFRRRWKYQQSLTNKQCGLILDENEWECDWQFLIRLTSPQPRNERRPSLASRLDRPYAAGQSIDSEAVYESLEELHVFALAHILRRPIIVIANSVLRDVYGEALAPIPFGGIYLPLERNPSECYRSPLLLTYDLAHFCALVSMETDSTLPSVIPLVTPEMELLQIHFSVDPDVSYDPEYDRSPELSLEDKVTLLHQYLNVQEVYVNSSPRHRDGGYDPLTWNAKKSNLARTDSEESGLSNGSGSGKDETEKRSKISKHVQMIAKSFDVLASKKKKVPTATLR